jgi:hypothetical protein
MGLSQGRLIVGALAGIVVVIGLLWIPVLGDRFTAFLSRTGPQAAPKILLAGGGLFVLGLIAGVPPLEIAGGSLVGLVVLAVLFDNY